MGEASPEDCSVDEEAVDLLEECWFFGNSLRRKSKNAVMSRCFSDPCPSADGRAREMLAESRRSSGSSSPLPGDINVEGGCSAPAGSFRAPPVVHEEPRDEAEPVLVDDGTPEGVRVSAELPPPSARGVQGRKCDLEEGSLDKHKQSPQPRLLRVPSLPLGRDKTFEGRENFPRMIKPSRQASLNLSEFLPSRHTPKVIESHSGCDLEEGSLDKHKQSPQPLLLRVPSLPPGIGRDKAFEGRESFPTMTKPSRQASLDLSEPRHTPKGMTQSASMPKYPSPKFSNAEESAIAFNREMRRRYLTRSNSKKSLSDLEDEEVRGFKELGFSFDKKHLNPNLVNILPGLQEKTQENEDSNKNEMPYLSEEWLAQSYAPTVPKWTAKVGSPEDMKAQIKFWARVVASNAHQEC